MMTAQDLSNQLFERFSRLVYEECGINLHSGKRELLQARLNKRLRATGIESYRQYYEHITSPNNNGEIIHFLDSISTNLTYFFREPKHFEFLDRIALPELLLGKGNNRNQRIRIWSAGCSTGEEPYSLAMSVLPHLDDPGKWDFKILATDISTRVLDVGLKGVYPKERVEKVPQALQKLYFQRQRTQNGDIFQISPALKRIVTFRRLNLKDNYPFSGPFDFIFCRNVMIYFDKETQQHLVQKMAGYLAEGGYLMVGHSESLTGLDHRLTYVQPSVYKKSKV
jgi:chemotaxis protein methyltransferase CheR